MSSSETGAEAGRSYRGRDLGLPEHGRGSMASLGVRVGALVIDWAAANLVTLLLTHGRLTYGTPRFSEVVLAVFAVEVWLLTWLFGGSFGQRIVGIAAVGLDGHRLPAVRALVRTVLICLVVPPLIVDDDHRGLHDRTVHAVVVRARD